MATTGGVGSSTLIPAPNRAEGVASLAAFVKRPVAERVSASFPLTPFSPIRSKRPGIALVTTGRTAPDLEAACKAWVSLIGEETPEELVTLMAEVKGWKFGAKIKQVQKLNDLLDAHTVVTEETSRLVIQILRQAVPATSWMKHTVHRKVLVSNSYSGGESTTRFDTYQLDGSIKEIRGVILALHVLLSAPEARRASGVISMEVV